MMHLADSLASCGNDVTYIARDELFKFRMEQGWKVPNVQNVKVLLIKSDDEIFQFLSQCSCNTIHICQGLRGNGYVQKVIHKLKLKQIGFWIIMETVEEKWYNFLLKRFIYSITLKYYAKNIEGFLAIGANTIFWLKNRGLNIDKCYKFAYFLPEPYNYKLVLPSKKNVFTFIYVGRLIKLKRVNLIIKTLNKLVNYEFKLIIVGDGPEYNALKKMSSTILSNRIEWVGQISMTEVTNWLIKSDCLLLPSRHDGWGAVASEALLSGTQVICSSSCGVSEVVLKSGYGGVFKKNDVQSFFTLIEKVLRKGKLTNIDRENISNWSKCVTSYSGANYLNEIFYTKSFHGEKPLSPWEK